MGVKMFGEITMWDRTLRVSDDGRFYRKNEAVVRDVNSLRGWENK